MCKCCELRESFYSKYNVFQFDMYEIKGEVILDINSEHNDSDELKINYCPMCGRRLGDD